MVGKITKSSGIRKVQGIARTSKLKNVYWNKKTHEKILCIVVPGILVFGVFALLIHQNIEKNTIIPASILNNSSTIAERISGTPQAPIHINGNADFASQASANGWTGDGTQGNPYIMEGYDIDAKGGTYCIWIENTSVWFVIRNCSVSNATGSGAEPWGTGIYLKNVTHGTLENNNCSANSEGGIWLQSSRAIIITDNILCNNGFVISGVSLESWNTHTIENNTVNGRTVYYYKDQDGGTVPSDAGQVILANCTNMVISGLTLTNTSIGIQLGFSSSTTITNNNLSGNGYGMYLFSSIGNTIINNIANNNKWEGILLWYSSNNTIMNNTADNNGDNGIYLYNSSSNNTIDNNTANNNMWHGISLWIFSHYNYITNNIASNNNRNGIYLGYSNYSTITNNTANNNINYHGISLEFSLYNTITYNNCSGNCWCGIYLGFSSNNYITNNNFYHNTNYGIYLTSGSTGNKIHYNNFWQNNGAGKGVNGNCQAYDSAGGNYWYNSITQRGNYWSNWDGSGWGTPNAYPIAGGAGAYDMYPFGPSAHGTIHINGNDDFANQAATNGWTGDGTQGNPYIIEGYEIDAKGGTYCIWIEFTDVWFIIRNCTVWNATGFRQPEGAGICLKNTQHGTLENNTCLSNRWGIFLDTSRDNYIKNNNCSGNLHSIYLSSSRNNPIENNNCSGNSWYGIYLSSSSNNIIMNNNCTGNSYGIFLESSSINNITNNKCSANFCNGIYLSSSSNNNIANNNCSNNSNGIVISYSSYTNITNNTCSGNSGTGIYVYSASNNNITNNTCSRNSDFGINLHWYSNNNIIMNNDCSLNSDFGIYIDIASSNNIMRNTCSGCWMGIGMYDASTNNILRYNNCSGNEEGIYISNNSCNNLITYNNFSKNTNYAIHITGASKENIIHHNNFWQNNGAAKGTTDGRSQAYDDAGGNYWYDSTLQEGNYWSNWNGFAGYSIEGGGAGAYDAYPLYHSVPLPPSAPRTLPPISGNGQITLTWDIPAHVGEGPIIDYKVYWGIESGNYSHVLNVGNVLTYTVTGLTNGQRYYFVVTAVNLVGESAKSGEVSATPSTVPSPPRNLTTVAGNGSVTLTWLPSANNGGMPITNYTIYYGTSPGNYTKNRTVSNITTYTVTGLTNGKRYYFAVSAINLAGEGQKSNETSAVPCTVPSAPQNMSATAGNENVTLTWEPPADTGGMPITNYTIYYTTSTGNYTNNITVGDITNYTLTGLSNGQIYYFAVSAINEVGEGAKSDEVSAVPCTVPSVPQNLQATAGNGYVTLEWQPPADNGGAAITDYKVYWGAESGNYSHVQNTGNVLTYTVTGLTNGQRYYFAVTVLNAAGESARSNEACAIPCTVPSAPRDLMTVAGNGNVTLTWAPPIDDGGTSITNYTIYYGTTSGTYTNNITVGNVTKYTIANLTNGQKYYFAVSAINAVGESEKSDEVSAMPCTMPSAPQNLTAVAGNDNVTLTWHPPASDGGSPVTGYKIYYGTSSGNYTTNITVGNVTNYTITNLTNGQKYYFAVSAINGAGEGARSNEVSATPVGEQQHGNTPGFDILAGICAIAVSMVVIAIWQRKKR